ncbi:MAG TPA: DUF1015 family protein [Thermoanaerobaculia bacterium]|nr:DUF1015 family protein [Thermoanaerobaculia bacterium]
MARVTPLRALRPDPRVAPRVSSVPYDVVSVAEARALAAGEPLSFLRVTRSEIELPEDADPYAPEVYELARTNLERLKREAPLATDPEPTLYVYRLTMGDHVQHGVAGAFSVEEYADGRIKKHEKTRRAKEDDRTRHIVTTRAQTGVVFLTYRARPAIDATVARVTAGPPLYDFVAADGVGHTLWAATLADRDALVDAFGEEPALYIADGHHRAASAWRAREELRAGRAPHPPAPGAGDFESFLAVAFPDDQVRVLPYHRVVLDLGGRAPAELAAELAGRFGTIDDAPQPSAPGRVSYYLEGRWRSFALPPAPAGTSVASALDCHRLQELVLEPLLDIGDLRTDPRIDFVGGIRGTAELERLVDSGRAAIAFAMHPVSAGDLFAVSDAGEIMPPKSTWFEPKLRDGLLIQEI